MLLLTKWNKESDDSLIKLMIFAECYGESPHYLHTDAWPKMIFNNLIGCDFFFNNFFGDACNALTLYSQSFN